MAGDDLLPFAGAGGVAACCLALELLGGTALVSSLAAETGLATGIMYTTVVSFGGVLAVALAFGYQGLSEVLHD